MSERIVIDIAVDEFEFIKEAITHKARSLISYLDTCKEHHEEQQAKPVTIGSTFAANKRAVGRPRKQVRRTRK
jgi:aspartate ammonia-lyase